MGDTTIRVSEELADELYARKDRGDTYEDVIWRLIREAEEEETVDIAAESVSNTEERPPEPEPNTPDEDAESIAAILEPWDPGGKTEAKLEAARAVLEYVRENGTVMKSGIMEDVYPENSDTGQNERTWWRKTARGDIDEGTHGALALGVQAGAIERHHGPPHEYEWVANW